MSNWEEVYRMHQDRADPLKEVVKEQEDDTDRPSPYRDDKIARTVRRMLFGEDVW